jgi:hypothetical protein
MFAETAIVDYRLSFAGQGKQTSVFRFPQTEKFAISIFHLRKQTGVAVFRQFRFPFAEFWKPGVIDLETKPSKNKTK